MSTRTQREEEFHNQRFSNPEIREKQVGRFYAITQSIDSAYKSFLSRNCRGLNIVEYGCGTGSKAFALAEQGAKLVVGIDISPVAIEMAAAIAESKGIQKNLMFRVMNAEDLEFSPHSIDLICGSGILHHLDLEKSLDSITRVLHPQGKAIFVEPMGHNLLINLYRKLTPNIRSEDEHPLLIQDLALLSKYFTHVEVKYFYLSAILASLLVGLPGFRAILRGLENLDRLLFKIPFLKYQAWQVLIVLSDPAHSVCH